MASMLTCEICLEKKSDRKPKSLNCLHSVCRDCLSSWVDTRSVGGNIECPVCRQHTKIPDNGVDGLIDDFKVLQLEEMIRAIGDPFVCQSCLLKGQSSKAKAKCQTCDRKLCHACYQYHLSQKIFEKHQVATDLCDVHGNGISHVCITCFTGLCVDCLLSEVHHDHEMYELEEGMEKLQLSVEKKNKQLDEMRKQIKVRIKTTEERTFQAMELNIAKLKQSADTMKQEIDRQVAEVIKRYRKQTATDLKASLDKYEEQYLPRSLSELTKQDSTEEIGNMKKILDYNIELNKKIRATRYAEQQVPFFLDKREIDKDILTDVAPPLSLKHFYDKIKTSNFDTILTENVFRDKLERPKLVFKKTSEKCEEIGIPRDLEVMDDFSAVVAFDQRDHAGRFDENGKVLAFYYCDGVGDQNKINHVTAHNGNIFMLCWDNHTVLHVIPGSFKKTIKHIKYSRKGIISFGFNPCNNTLIVSQDQSNGKVFQFRETDMSPEECSLTSGYIRVLPYAGSYRIVVASWNTKAVMVYDEDETLLYTLEGCGENDPFKGPNGIAVLGYDTLLVADMFNHCISKFKLSDGSFDGLLLTEADGIKYPAYIACKYPYLWVAGRWTMSGKEYGSLKLYKLS